MRLSRRLQQYHYVLHDDGAGRRRTCPSTGHHCRRSRRQSPTIGQANRHRRSSETRCHVCNTGQSTGCSQRDPHPRRRPHRMATALCMGSDTHTNYAPAIFTHPTFANRTTHSEAPMDPPLVREWMTAATNTPLHAPTTVEPNVQRLMDDLLRAEPFRRGDPEATPAVAYHPSPAADAVPLPPFFEVRHGRNRPMLSDLSQIHETQQLLMQRREASRRAAGKGQGKGRPRPEVAVSTYLGDNKECTICLEDFEHDQRVFRLTCNHIFHEECWTDYILQEEGDLECPNCRGPGVCKALYRYVGATRGEARSSRDAASSRMRRPPQPPQGGEASVSSYADAASQSSEPPAHETTLMATAAEIKEWVDSWRLLSLNDWLAARGQPHMSAGTQTTQRQSPRTRARARPRHCAETCRQSRDRTSRLLGPTSKPSARPSCRMAGSRCSWTSVAASI